MSFEVDIKTLLNMTMNHSTMKANEIYLKCILRDQIKELKLIETLKLEIKKPKNKGETLYKEVYFHSKALSIPNDN